MAGKPFGLNQIKGIVDRTAQKPNSLETIENFGKGLADLCRADRTTNKENFAKKLAEEQTKDTQERD